MKPFRIFKKKEVPKKSEEQLHYDNIISFFKWALQFSVSLLVLAVTAAAILFYRDRAQFNADIKSYLDVSRNQIIEMVSDAKSTLKETKDQSNLLSSSLRTEADRNIQYIREDAKSMALNEATKQVNAAFKEKNVQKMIEDAAEKEIATSVQEMVFDKLRLLPNILLALDRIRVGQKESFLYLDSIAKYSLDPFYKSIADSIVNSKRNEYEKSAMDEIKCLEYIRVSDLLASGFSAIEAFDIWKQETKDKKNVDSTEVGCRNLFNETMDDIEFNGNLNHIAFDFKVLRFLTGEKIEMFDFDRIKTIKYKEGIKHPYKCTEDGAVRL